MFVLLNIFWFFRTFRYVLFWLYLWQLKEYHIGRFIDHFRTYKGKKLLFGFLQTLKIVLLLFFLIDVGFFVYLFSILFLVYLIESILFLVGVIKKTIKRPVTTSKTLFLITTSLAIVILFLAWISEFKNESQLLCLLIFDVLTPLVVSAIVLFFQPFFVLIRNNILKKAEKKMEKMKSVSGLKVIAITGSYGKTSTKEFLAAMLSEKFKVLATKEHQNSEVGVAECILKDLKPSHQFFVAEIGAYNKGKIKEVCNILKPDMGIVTGVNEQHLALFGSMENLLSAEGGEELLESLPSNGKIFVNGENKYCLELIKKSNKLPPAQEKIYALSNKTVNSDIWAEEIEIKKDNLYFIAANRKKEMAHFEVKVLGKQNVQNLLGAILVASELGMSFGEISDSAKSIKPEQAGMVLKQGKHGINVIDSSYSANPDGVVADLDYLSVFPQKKVIVMPCLIELGPKSSEIHEKLGRKISEVCDMAIITSKDKFEEIKKGFNSLISHACLPAGRNKRIILCDNSQDIYSAITSFCKSGDAVLLEGRVSNTLIKLLTE